MWGCNGGEHPQAAAREGHVSLAPMELMFVAVNRNMLQLKYPSALAAVAYDAWGNRTATVRPCPSDLHQIHA